jgi:integrase
VAEAQHSVTCPSSEAHGVRRRTALIPVAYGYVPKPVALGLRRTSRFPRIDPGWHDLRHEGACRLLPDGLDIRLIELTLGHASIQRMHLNVTNASWIRRIEALRPAA